MMRQHFLRRKNMILKGNQNYMSIFTVLTNKLTSLICKPSFSCSHRFKPENLTDKLKDAFFGFGDGPRRCVAEQLGLIKVKVVVSNIIKNFKIDLVPGQKHHIFADMTARFKEPPMFNLSLR